MGTENLVSMKCPECNFVITRTPETFLNEFRCPQCLQLNIFRKLKTKKPALKPGEAKEKTEKKGHYFSKNLTANHYFNQIKKFKVAIGALLLLGLLAIAGEYSYQQKLVKVAEKTKKEVLQAIEKNKLLLHDQLNRNFAEKFFRIMHIPKKREKRNQLLNLQANIRDTKIDLAIEKNVSTQLINTLLAINKENFWLYENKKMKLQKQLTQADALQDKALQLQKQAENLITKAKKREIAAEKTVAKKTALNQKELALAAQEARLHNLEKKIESAQREWQKRDTFLKKREEKLASREEQISKAIANLSKTRQKTKIIFVPGRNYSSPNSSSIKISKNYIGYPYISYPYSNYTYRSYPYISYRSNPYISYRSSPYVCTSTSASSYICK